MIKKNVFQTLEDFILERYLLFLEEEELHEEYESKLNEIEEKFLKRMEELAKAI